jgi:hypothetical protein
MRGRTRALEHTHQLRRARRSLTTIVLAGMFVLATIATAHGSGPGAASPEAGPPGQESAPVAHLPPGLDGDPVLVEGATARLLRTDDRLITRTNSRELTPGHVQTLWWVIFNNPDECATTPCGMGDLFVDEVEASCQIADGAVTAHDGQASFFDRLAIGESRDSCLPHFGGTDHGLVNPLGAEVHLMVHDHGPLQPGKVPEMRSTFDGGCDFDDPDYPLGTFGIVPQETGQCATIQAALFLP